MPVPTSRPSLNIQLGWRSKRNQYPVAVDTPNCKTQPLEIHSAENIQFPDLSDHPSTPPSKYIQHVDLVHTVFIFDVISHM